MEREQNIQKQNLVSVYQRIKKKKTIMKKKNGLKMITNIFTVKLENMVDL